MPNALDDRTEKEDSGDSGTNSSGVVTAFNTTQEMEMEAVNLDDSVGLPVVPMKYGLSNHLASKTEVKLQTKLIIL